MNSKMTEHAITLCWKLRDTALTFEERCAFHERGMRILKRYWSRLLADSDEEYIGYCEAMEASRTTDRDMYVD